MVVASNVIRDLASVDAQLHSPQQRGEHQAVCSALTFHDGPRVKQDPQGFTGALGAGLQQGFHLLAEHRTSSQQSVNVV